MFFKKKSAKPKNSDSKLGKKKTSLITGLIVGGAVGSVMSLLFAPSEGKKTRAQMAKKGRAVFDGSKSQAAKFLDKYQKRVKNEIEK